MPENLRPIFLVGDKIRHASNKKRGTVATLPGKRTYFNSSNRTIYIKWFGGKEEWIPVSMIELDE